LVAAGCQFLVMPGLAYLLGWLLLETNYERLGLLLLGSSPGGAHSNFWVALSLCSLHSVFQTAMFHGDINLSCTCTFVSTIGSFAFTSLWAYLLGAPLIGKNVPIPYLKMTLSLAFITFPLLLGVAFKVDAEPGMQ
jgi:predicted Na+-dependent transporter